MKSKLTFFIVIVTAILSYSVWTYLKKQEWLKGSYLWSETFAYNNSFLWNLGVSDEDTDICIVKNRNSTPLIFPENNFKQLVSKYCDNPNFCIISEISQSNYTKCASVIEALHQILKNPCSQNIEKGNKQIFRCDSPQPMYMDEIKIEEFADKKLIIIKFNSEI